MWQSGQEGQTWQCWHGFLHQFCRMEEACQGRCLWLLQGQACYLDMHLPLIRSDEGLLPALPKDYRAMVSRQSPASATKVTKGYECAFAASK